MSSTPASLSPIFHADRAEDNRSSNRRTYDIRLRVRSCFAEGSSTQVLQVTRKTRALRTRRWRRKSVYAVTSLDFAQGRPARLADLLRGRWAIEALHHLCDVTFAGYDSQVRTGAGPSVMACLRNLVIGALNRAGLVNTAATPATHADPLPLSGSDSDETDITTERRALGSYYTA